MGNRIRSVGSYRTLAVCLVLCSVALLVAGCSATTTSSTETRMPGAATSGAMTGAKMAGNMSASKADPNVQMCLECSVGTKSAPVSGTVEASTGKQVVNIAIKGGTYTPNQFVATASSPITVVFTVDGKPAKGCLSKPTFKSLGKSLEVTSGTESIDLGSLAPGTYPFTCAMGMNAGNIVVR